MTEVRRNLVPTKIKQVFPDRHVPDILAVLDRYGGPERDRVHLAILKLCDEEGKPDPAGYTEAAIRDFRDVLMWAESPNQANLIACCDDGLRAEIEEQDRIQYRNWLAKR
jgi:hypothetical protein